MVEPTIQSLIAETQFLKRNLRALLAEYTDSEAVQYIFSLHRRFDLDQAEPSDDLKAALEWHGKFVEYMGHLVRYFRDWQVRPDKVERFPLARRSRIYKIKEATGIQHAVIVSDDSLFRSGL